MPNSIAGLELATLLALCRYLDVYTGANMKLSELLDRIDVAAREMSEGGKRLRAITIKEIAYVLVEFNKLANDGNKNTEEQIDELESRLNILAGYESEETHSPSQQYLWVLALLRKLRIRTCFAALVEEELELWLEPIEIAWA